MDNTKDSGNENVFNTINTTSDMNVSEHDSISHQAQSSTTGIEFSLNNEILCKILLKVSLSELENQTFAFLFI